MKTMKNYDKIVRVNEKDVKKYLDNDYYFINKSKWKEELRDINKTKVSKEETEK